jgi:protein SHQ1
MVLTPRFSLSQDDQFVIVTMHVPFLKTSTMDFLIGEREFKFCVHPYFLRLTLPHDVVESGKERATYDVESGSLVIYVPKAQVGQHFADLDMLTTLHQPTATQQPAAPKIQEIPSSASSVPEQPPAPPSVSTGLPPPTDSLSTAPAVALLQTSLVLNREHEEHLLDRMLSGENVPLHEILPPAPADLRPRQYYGFNSAFSDYFASVAENITELLEIPDPDRLPLEQRRAARLAREEEKFDPEHYQGDFIVDAEIREALQLQPQWALERAQVEALFRQTGTPPEKSLIVLLSQDDSDILLRLKNKNYLVESEPTLLLSLIDILFAYCYEFRVMTGDFGPESALTIAHLSATLTWFEQFATLADVLRSCFRRALCFPLYRHWRLAEKAAQDVETLLLLGKRAVLRTLLRLKVLLEKGELSRHLCALYLDDYSVWIQQISEQKLLDCAAEFKRELAQLHKENIGWPLVILEAEAEENRAELMSVDGVEQAPAAALSPP